MKDDIYGEVPVGFVVIRPGRDLPPAALLDHCRDKLAAFKVPRAVIVVDAIPKNANGKIDRDALTGLWQHGEGQAVAHPIVGIDTVVRAPSNPIRG